jgi:hypothetical protein
VSPTSSTPLARIPQSTVSGMIDELAQKSFSSMFGGVTMSENGTQPTIYLTTLNPVVEKAFFKLSLAKPPLFATNPYTWQQQLDAVDRLAQDRDVLVSAGVQLRSWYPDAALGRVQVTVTGDPADRTQVIATATSVLSARYGGILEVAKVEQADQQDAVFTGRANDTPPWNGGDFITVDGSTGCTSGFGLRSNVNGQEFLATAAHCFSTIGSVVRNHSGGLTPGFGTNTAMATIAYIDTSTYGQDIALLRTSNYGGSNNKVWGGSTGSPFTRTVTGWGNVSSGDVVQTIGAFDGESSGLVVTNVHGCYTVEGRSECGISEAVDQFGRYANGQGDSGGPVWNNNGGVKAVGTISFGFGTQSTCPNYSVGYTPTRTCFTGVGFTDIQSTLNNWNLSPVL